MKTQGFHAFFVSFCVSLFAIYFADNAFLRDASQNKPSKVVPSKNIVLFLKSDMQHASPTPINQIKKISLNVIPEVPQAQEIKIASEDVEVEAVPVEDIVKKLEKVEVFEAFEEPDGVPIVYEKPAVMVEKIIKDYDKFVEKPVIVQAEPAVEPESVSEIKKIVYAPEAVKQEEKESPIPIMKNDKPIYDGDVKVVSGDDVGNQVADASLQNFSFDDKSVDGSGDEVEVVNQSSGWVEMKDAVSDEVPEIQSAEAVATPMQDNTWDVAQGIKNPKNQMVLEQNLPKPEVVKNLLIPLPDEAFENPDALPQIVSQKSGVEEQNLRGGGSEEVVENMSGFEEAKRSSILQNLNSLFTKTSEVGAEIKEQVSSVVSRVSSANTQESAAEKAQTVKRFVTPSILPTEIRLSFAPNRAEISGQTVRWLDAFAQKAKEENVFLEVRIDGTSPQELQQKRLNLIYNVFSSKGVEDYKVNTVFTNREPNSFVVRTVRIEPKERNNYSENKSYQQW